MATCIALITIKTKELEHEDSPINETLKQYPLSMVLLICGFGFGIFVFSLLGFHTFLLYKNSTTNEYIKEHWKIKSQNPYHVQNCLKNYAKTICNKKSKSNIKLRKEIYLINNE